MRLIAFKIFHCNQITEWCKFRNVITTMLHIFSEGKYVSTNGASEEATDKEPNPAPNSIGWKLSSHTVYVSSNLGSDHLTLHR